MASTFELITEEFIEDMEAIRSMVLTFSDADRTAKARIAAANSATLLVAATFEEFVREMAREYARTVVANTDTVERLPSSLAQTAWKRTMNGLSKVKFEDNRPGLVTWHVAAQARFTAIYEFCKGDLTQDIYRELIHNENNMRPNELNGLFKLSGLSDVCKRISDKQPMLENFGEAESVKAHSKFMSALEDFIDRRNAIAHALNSKQSSGPRQIINDLDMLQSFGKALRETLDASTPKPTINPIENNTGKESLSWWQRLITSTRQDLKQIQ